VLSLVCVSQKKQETNALQNKIKEQKDYDLKQFKFKVANKTTHKNISIKIDVFHKQVVNNTSYMLYSY
jgi:hypothetical protein